RYAVDLLLRNPQSAAWLSETDGLTPRSGEAVLAEMRATTGRYEAQPEAVAALRAIRRSELLRLAMADILNELDVDTLGHALSELAGATIEATIELAARELAGVPKLAVIALGRWGGEELSYSSDADAMIVIDSEEPAATQVATTLVSRMRALLSQPGPDPALQLDLDLRPEGKGGPMVRSLASYTAYYRRWSSTWEAQALLRARVGAGDRELGERLLARTDRLRYPAEGLTHAQVVEIRKLKARMENERVGRGSDPRRNLKLGPGGLSDVEWVVQLQQLQHAGAHPELRTPYTIDALRAAQQLGLIESDDADALADAWAFASRIRNAIMLSRGRASDTIPTDIRELAAVAQLLGYGKGESSLLVEDWQRRARLARQVMDRLFWNLPG
ncbi:MAG: bifunctional glutamine-synthetase adenylyltransferase/deadenyltransferase, partial [Propionibacteriaceae bacterium]|nr:bifunctional glutamine-synthetase adenylyltransferase/deadenyltransferase [Propionibacteriaceae bacterium]